MPNLLNHERITREVARDILQRTYDQFMTAPLINVPCEWESRETLAHLLRGLPSREQGSE